MDFVEKQRIKKRYLLSFCFVKYRALSILRITTAHRQTRVDEDKELNACFTIAKIQDCAVRK